MCHVLQVAGVGVGSSVAVALREALCCPPHWSWQGAALSCSERAESEQGYTSYPRMPCGRAVCLSPAHGRCCSMPWCGEGPGAGWATPQIPSPGFPSSCFAGCLCLTAQGAVRTCKDSTFLSSPLVCSSSSTVWESGRSGKCLLCVSHARKEPRGGKKHPQHPAGVEAAQNEVQSPKMRCRPLKGSWEDCWALNQYPCSLIYSTGHMHALIGGVMVLHLIYLTTEGTLISY